MSEFHCQCGNTDLCEYCTDYHDYEKPGKEYPFRVPFWMNLFVFLLRPLIGIEKRVKGERCDF